ncbi:MAG: DUF1349 domain-containing protein [Anaerolineae bacterium]
MDTIEGFNSASLAQLSWTNPPTAITNLSHGGLRIGVPARVDYFQDPAGKVQADSAPYLALPVSGDFVARAHIRHPFQSVYDAGAIMVRQDARNWAKLCFEATDFGTRAVVSVVTRDYSDDANGVDVAAADIWLQLARKGNLFAMHYSLDGRTWRMVRYFNLALAAQVQVGLVAQCPSGDGAEIDWLAFEVSSQLPANLRAGV